MQKKFDYCYAWVKWFTGSSLWRYLVTGGSTVLLDFLILLALHEIFKLPVLVAASVSYWSSICFNFLMNNYWTFKARKEVHMSVFFYALLLGFNFVFTIGFIAAARAIGVHYTFAKMAAIAVSLCWTYLLYKKVVFRQTKA